MPADPQTVLATAIAAAKAGGDVLMSYFRREVTIRFKNNDAADMVSEADVNAEQAVIRVIHETFPDHAILGEESATDTDVNSAHLWVIDPLDGTTNFLHHVPHFAVSIAYFESGEPICGVVFNPAHNDLYTALRGQGATYNGQPAHVSLTDRMDQSLIGTGFYYDRGPMMEATLAAIRDLYAHQIHCIRRFGSAALDLCQVATGLYGAYFEYRLSAWDFAAGLLIVQEAGGTVTNGRGQPLKLCRSSVLASNTKLHPTMVKIVSRHHDEFPADM